MKFVYPGINERIEIMPDSVQTIVIENQRLLHDLLCDLMQQLQGYDGKAVLSHEHKTLEISKNVEVITDFVSFDLNKKTLLSKVCAALEKEAYEAEHFMQTRQLLTALEQYLEELAFGFPCDITAGKIQISSVLKAIGIELRDEYDSDAEKLIDYMELVREFDRDKLFVTVNMRGFFVDAEMAAFMETVVSHGYHLLMLESRAYDRLPLENRMTIDEDLCIF